MATTAIGLKVCKIFQRKLNDANIDLPGVFAVADDVIVVGRGETDSTAMLDHNANIHAQFSLDPICANIPDETLSDVAITQ